MAKIYLYKMTVDNGGAPCVYDGKLSLAICKPAIRMSAEKGDIVLGFAGNSLYPETKNCLIYAIKVEDVLPGGDYYTDVYKDRPDCIYERFHGKYKRRSTAIYHHGNKDLRHDLGQSPTYKRAKVLLTTRPEDFRYWGSSCPIEYPKSYTELATFIRKMTQGHRVNMSSMSESVRIETQCLLRNIWNTAETKDNTPVPFSAEHSSSPTCFSSKSWAQFRTQLTPNALREAHSAPRKFQENTATPVACRRLLIEGF